MVNTQLYQDTPETDPRFTKHLAKRQQIEKIRESAAFRNARERFKQECAREGRYCHLCGDQIDYRLPYPHPFSWSLDHIRTVKEFPNLMMDPANFAASHLDCNLRRGTDEPALDLGLPSEIW